MYILKNKKGIEAGGLSIVIAIIILLLSGGVILAGIRHAASKVDEKLQVDLCRILNEIKFGISGKSESLLTSGEPICNTITKHIDEKSFVPTSQFKQDKEGAEQEIRDMVKNCWYMWLDGSKQNMFREYTFSEGCFTCYTFKIKENVKGVTYTSLKNSMDNPFFAKDTSDKCAPTGGGFLKLKCDKDEEEVVSKKTPVNSDYKCCRKDLRNECENKGGKCSSAGKPSEDYSIYNKWPCPKSEQSCYVKNDGFYSYTKYIREYGPRGGEIFFMPPHGEKSPDINYAPGEIYAINFVSPSKQICYKGAEAGAGCYAAIGGYAVATAAGGIVLVKFGGAIAGVAGGATKLLSMIGIKTGLAAIGVYKLGILDNLLKGTSDFVVSGMTEEVPNFIIVSTLDDAKEYGCTVKYTE